MDDEKKRNYQLLRGRAWAIFDILLDTTTDTYKHMKEVLLRGLNPDTEEN